MSKLSLKDLLFICFCAVLLIAVRAAFRWRLGISGHAMFFTVFFLLLSRGCVKHRLTATLTGFLAGAAAIALGMGKGGPLTMLNFLFPALAIDLGAFIFPSLLNSYLLCALVGTLAGASKLFSAAVIGFVVGMDHAILWQRALIEAAAAMAFGCLGALCLPPVVKRLRAYGLPTASGE
ncbi:MAG: hypothetical protein GX751_02775 [Desulfuromonadaceae bacterium]|nr:hypothetical protein [Desulfuromonadaceae bacterium]